VAALQDEGAKEALVAAEAALDKLLGISLGAAIAAFSARRRQTRARKNSGGRWEAFAAWPSLPRLLDCSTSRGKASVRAAVGRREAFQHTFSATRAGCHRPGAAEDEDDEQGMITSLVLAHAHLLNGRWEAAGRWRPS